MASEAQIKILASALQQSDTFFIVQVQTLLEFWCYL